MRRLHLSLSLPSLSNPMDIPCPPFVPRYKSKEKTVGKIIGCGLDKEDLVQDIYDASVAKSQQKIEAFLEKESYVLRNEFPATSECGLVLLPCFVDL